MFSICSIADRGKLQAPPPELEPAAPPAVIAAMRQSSPASRGILRPALIALLTAFVLSAIPAAMADDIPVPVPRPERPSDVKMPDKAAANDTGAPAEPDLADIPVPQPRPEQSEDKKPDGAKNNGKHIAAPDKPSKDELAPDVRPTAMPAQELACRSQLADLGVIFKELPQLSDEAGCSVPWPIEVSNLGGDVELAPAGVFNCAVAERSAAFMRDVVVPRSQKLLGSPVRILRQASAYVCRPRNGSSKLSEHAFGNALDIDSFVLADKRTLGVGRVDKPDEASFMLGVRLAACGPYTTVLGPGSNADHATHFHFDLARRRPGSTYCK
jgi:hypothetical protein